MHDVGELRDRHLGVVGEHEHQPRDAGVGGRVELELGVGDAAARHRHAVAEPDEADVDVAGADLRDAELRRVVVAGPEVGHVDAAVPGAGDGALG